MLLILLLSFSVGYLLNEEQALRRICKNMSYPHEGWLVMQTNQALGGFIGSFIVSFSKAFLWAKLVSTTPNYAHLAMVLYICGNMIAVKQINGLYYTPWLTLLGIGVVLNPLFFQLPCTAFCVVCLLSRNFTLSVEAAILSGALAACWLGLGRDEVFVLGGIYITWYFSSRQSQIIGRLIRYR